jgi:hypothetical protein
MEECIDLFFYKYVYPYIATIESHEHGVTGYHIPIMMGGPGFFKKDSINSFNWILAMG